MELSDTFSSYGWPSLTSRLGRHCPAPKCGSYFLAPDGAFKFYVKAARNTGGRVVLETNSTLVTDHVARQIAECADLVGVSLDSLTRHGEYRGLANGTKKAIKGIKTS
jgi:hypothetical protein